MTNESEVFNIDINELTISQIVEIEERTGQPFDSLGDPTAPKGKINATTDPVDPTDGDEQ